MLKQIRNKSAVVGASILGAVGSAHAALPTEATAAFTTISGNVTDVLAAMWPIVALATGGFILIKLFKKGANKSV
ncbi:MAG: phage coat protein [Desulfurellales bacterium]|nr:MAG: phage coat protein [Desulfurellales bacterium]